MMTQLNQRMAGVAAALIFSAGAAVAQSSGGGGTNKIDFYRPLDQSPTTDQQTTTYSTTKMMMSQSDGDDTYEITVDGDEVTAKVNGKQVAKDRVRRTDDKIEILDKDGDVVSTFRVGRGGTTVWSGQSPMTLFHGQGGGAGAWSADPFSVATWQEGKAPPVMLGVTMVEPSESVSEQLELEPGSGVQLDKVVSGLSADKAGLKKGDVLVSFDGTKPITAGKVREILATKKAGDKVQVVYLRKGDEKKTTMELQKYDAERLDSMPKAYAGAMGANREEIAKAQERAQKAMEEIMKNQHTLTLRGGGIGGQPGTVLIGPNGDPFEVYTHRFGHAATPEAKEKITELQKRISELDEKISKLDEALDRLEKKLDKLNDRK
jgi:hypothetical protein